MYDFCVNGGGMIGAATALGLIRQGYRVALLEPQPATPYSAKQGPDLRVSALSMASIDLLKDLGAWPYLQAMRMRAYTRLSVWEAGGARTDFDAGMIDAEQVGYFIENRLVQLACMQALSEHPQHENLTVREEAAAHVLFDQPHGCTVTLSNLDTLQCRWIIGADGAQSVVRRQAGIGTTGWQYGQQALGVVVKTAQPVPDWTWQEFHPSGPRAFLPMYDNFGSFVWYDSPATIQSLSKLDNRRLAQRIEEAFPDQTGPFEVLEKAAFPLSRMHAQHYVARQAIITGDAAHTINPLAGQGVNIGYKDVAALLAVTQQHLEPTAMQRALKSQYEGRRRTDNLAMMSAMDAFYVLFSNPLPPVKWLRNTMLATAQRAQPAKQHILRYAMGLPQWKF